MNYDRPDEAQALRGAIESQIPSPGAVCITAALSSDATETVALAVAGAFASSGHKTLLLDASGAGDDAVDYDLASLPELQAGAAVADPTRTMSKIGDLNVARLSLRACERLRADEVKDIMATLRAQYNAVVVNVGESATGGSGLFFAHQSDAVVVSVRMGRTAGRADRILLERLATVSANVIGIVPVSGRARRRNRRALAVIDQANATPAVQTEARLAR
jgi:Mrp family chromosome partitioning ATPase